MSWTMHLRVAPSYVNKAFLSKISTQSELAWGYTTTRTRTSELTIAVSAAIFVQHATMCMIIIISKNIDDIRYILDKTTTHKHKDIHIDYICTCNINWKRSEYTHTHTVTQRIQA